MPIKKRHFKKYSVQVSASEKKSLHKLIRAGTHPARTILRARLLLLVDEGKNDVAASTAADVSVGTVRNVRKRYAQGGLTRALYDAPRPGQPAALSAQEKAKITAIACTDPPDGYGRWTLDLLEEKVAADVKAVGRSTIHRVLLGSDLKPWREKNVVYSND